MGPSIPGSSQADDRLIGLLRAGDDRDDTIGPYRLLESIAEGGFGEVWLAEQREPIARRVAIKIIKPGMDSKAVIARFELERQALALMDHPNIAKVYDAGTTARGRPFFVMEHIRGEPITAYCDRHRLTIAQRLELFSKVCEAVQHAHSKGIIHRDLKPSNILVVAPESASAAQGAPAMPVPKIIDFGVAKAVAARLTEKTIYTEMGQLIGTPEYMSPEQAEMAETDIDTRTDVYALGVILYELLTGVLPFDSRALREAGYSAIQRIIRESPPPRPSTRVSGLGVEGDRAAEARRLRPDDLASALRSELEWIPLKAMRKDRAERYRTTAELGDDLANYLAHRPLIAGPETATYKFRKFVRRNRGAVVAACAVVLALIAGLAGTLWQARVAAERAGAAQRAQRRAESINEFVRKALVSSDPNQGGSQGTLVADAMRSALAELDAGAFHDDPQIDADLRSTIAEILQGNGQPAEAERQYARALEITRGRLRGDHRDIAKALNNLAGARRDLGRAAEAEGLYSQALEMVRRLDKADDPFLAACLNNLASVRQALGRSAEAEGLHVQALEMRRRLFPGDHDDVAQSLNNLGSVRRSMGRLHEAEPLYRQALEMRQRLFPRDHPMVAASLSNLASLLKDLDRPAEAEPMNRGALEMWRRLFPGDHASVAVGFNNLASTLQALGRLEEAESLYMQGLEMRRRLFPGDHPAVANSLGTLGGVRTALGRLDDAEKLHQEALEMRLRLHQGDHMDVARSMNSLAGVREKLGRHAEALEMAERALAMGERLYPDGHPQVATFRKNLERIRTGAPER